MGVKRPWRVCSRHVNQDYDEGWVVATYATREKAVEVAAVLRAEEMEEAGTYPIWVEGPAGPREVVDE